jgi:predicted P-loop ATPase
MNIEQLKAELAKVQSQLVEARREQEADKLLSYGDQLDKTSQLRALNQPSPFEKVEALEAQEAKFEAEIAAHSKAIVEAQPGKAKSLAAFQRSRNPTGIPPSFENALIAIDQLGAECCYDVFHDRIIVRGHECGVRGDVHENMENIVLKVRQAVLADFGFDPGAGFTLDAIRARCLDHIFDPVLDYLDGLRWDGVKRIDTWLVRYCGANATPLNRAIGRKMLLAACRRVRSPGCKFDYIIVLEGPQGAGKSTMLKLLAGEDNFSDNEIIGIDKREQQEAIQGIWIYEMAELEGLHKSDVTKVKLFASKTVDMARPAYARSRVDRPRRCILVATTNEETYLRDMTGNRRFWPVRLGTIDLPAVAQDRDQLWAEAAMAEATGEPLVIPETLWPDVAKQQAARMELDPWEDTLAPRLSMLIHNTTNRDGPSMLDGFTRAADKNGDPEWRVATDYLLTEILGLPKERQNNNHTKRLADVMRSLGWSRSDDPLRFGKQQKRGFTRSVVEAQSDRVTGVTGCYIEPETPMSIIPDQSITSDVTPVTPVTNVVRITRRI